ncbi:hypothetical protein A6A08_15075 [Nocardiopsis sp. TSRI0078]|uniref:hypothetical protein n=1 Tax=unclassified Nocardiopsis TaxID=2649073 RepID=UPI000939AEF5|nr:hypothetical protein [Nocardiopsis sp. TSRI0078]OKI13607.1 hypothetical protein A6A08_15075 [Nocardiopsis sp. TSRI0078]
MPEHTDVRRLKSAVRARSLAEEGVALSMGATAVVVRGARADTVWRALEPALRAGFTRQALTERFPAGGRPFLEGVLDQLEEHGFLREVEEEHGLSETELAAYPHVESLTARPYAALRALAESTVRVRSSCPLLEAEVRRALGRAGFREVHADTGPGTGALLTTRLSVPGREEALHLVDTGRGVWVSGPRNAPGGPGLVERVRAWFAAPGASGEGASSGADGAAGVDEENPALAVTRSLVAAQLALALVAQVARSVDGTEPPGDPEFMVTTDELVSEPHPFVALPALDPGTEAPPPGGAAPPEEVPDQLDAVAHLWDRVFGPVGEPRPDDLEQLPVGLARVERSPFLGAGTTTASARLDALLTALHAVAWPGGAGREAGTGAHGRVDDAGERTPAAEPADPVDLGPEPPPHTTARGGEDTPEERGHARNEDSVGLGLGLTPVAAVGEAVGDLVVRARDRWKDVDPPEPMPASARRLWAALTLRFGVGARLRHQELDGTGLWRVAVLGPDGEAMGVSAAPDADAATVEALLRAVARVQSSRDGGAPGATVSATATRTGAVTASLARWARETGLVRVYAPGGAGAWAERGVYAAVASWT